LEKQEGGKGRHTRKKGLKGILIASFVAALAFPLIVLFAWAGASLSYFTFMRLLGLEAFTLIFVNIVTGATSRYLYRLFKAKRVYRFHLATGVAGFLLALFHGVIVLVEGYFRNYSALWIIGPVALILLACTAYAALDKKRLPRIWRRIHQVNYLIFAGLLVKVLLIGSDVSVPLAYATALKAVFIVYGAAAAVATALRIWQYEDAARKKRARQAAGA
jgi:hypothetical protein